MLLFFLLLLLLLETLLLLEKLLLLFLEKLLILLLLEVLGRLSLFIRFEINVPFINRNLGIKFYYRFVISNQVVLLF